MGAADPGDFEKCSTERASSASGLTDSKGSRLGEQAGAR